MPNYIKKYAKTFYWAGKFLDKEKQNDCSILYAFCRVLDDIADNNKFSIIKKKRNIKFFLKDFFKKNSKNSLIKELKRVQNKYSINKKIITDLIKGIFMDTKLVRIKDNKELIQYSYLVAGTVGIMMADILGVKNKLAKKYALDLGIAMQLTNICRDVLNDANLGRIYLPENYFGEVNIKNIIGKEADEKKIFETVKNIINLAEKYYNSGNLGIAFIPKESKFAIFLASNLYRAIGIKIIKHGFSNFLKRRAYLSILEKIFITIQSYILFLFRNKFNKFPIKHSSALHASIKNLINARI